MKTTEDLNRELSSRCGVVLLTKEEATEAMMRPIIAAGREQETRERYARLLDTCRNAKNQNEQVRRLVEDQETYPSDEKITITIPRYWQTTARDYHEFKNMAYYYEEAGLKVDYEEVGCSGDYYAIFWIGKKPTKIINEAKETFES
jgi:hypothetical protein